MIIGGSFVTRKRLPNDYDGCWDPTGVDVSLLDPVMLPPNNGDSRKFDGMKAKYGGELIPARWPSSNPEVASLVDYFQFNTRKVIPTGVVRVNLKTLDGRN